jgi:hypothetical protein
MELIMETNHIEDVVDLLTRGEKLAGSRLSGRRAEALTVLSEVRSRLTALQNTPTTRELDSPNWSAARLRHLLDRVKRASVLAESR